MRLNFHNEQASTTYPRAFVLATMLAFVGAPAMADGEWDGVWSAKGTVITVKGPSVSYAYNGTQAQVSAVQMRPGRLSFLIWNSGSVVMTSERAGTARVIKVTWSGGKPIDFIMTKTR